MKFYSIYNNAYKNVDDAKYDVGIVCDNCVDTIALAQDVDSEDDLEVIEIPPTIDTQCFHCGAWAIPAIPMTENPKTDEILRQVAALAVRLMKSEQVACDLMIQGATSVPQGTGSLAPEKMVAVRLTLNRGTMSFSGTYVFPI
jgi:hypothetical protein